MNDDVLALAEGRSIRRHIAAGAILCAVVTGAAAGWAALAPLGGAVIGLGTLAVEGAAKAVQHPEGGVVAEIRVREGQAVAPGDLLIRLDGTMVQANLMVIETQLVELEARRARLSAERDQLAGVVFPDVLTARAGDPVVQAAIRGESVLFQARRDGQAGNVAQLRERIGQLAEEAAGLEAQIAATDRALGLIRSEIADLVQLQDKGLVPITRLRALQREEAVLEGNRGELTAGIARSRGQRAEIELQILQIEQDFRTGVIADLRQIEASWGELVQKRIAAEDRLRRVDLRAPAGGIVHQMAVHTVGGVLDPGETAMLIVPHDDRLTVEVRISPADIDQVFHGQPATLRFTAFNQRTTPEIAGRVTHVAADLTTDRDTGQSYYLLHVAPETEALDGLALRPGMPAEVYLRTGERTAISYLVKPLGDQIARAMRER